MLSKLADKFIFGIALILALQIPQLADHYHQFLSGLYESTEWQIEGYQATAKKHGYVNVQTMINHHLQNSVSSVRTDAQQKLDTLEQFEALTTGIAVFEHGNLLNKIVYMISPEHLIYTKKTLHNFRPGIPLSIHEILFGFTIGLLLNFIIALPFLIIARLKKRAKPAGLFQT